MTRPIDRRPPLIAAVTLIMAAALAWPRAAVSEPPTSQAAPPATPVVGPIAYYVASCARCHGDVSAAYVGLEHPRRGDALKQEIDDMAQGPAQAPLDAEGLKRQTALHEAMFGKAPFVWVDPTARERLGGEVLSGTTLTFEPAAGLAVTPAIDDYRFDLPRRPGMLIARRGDAVVKIAVQ